MRQAIKSAGFVTNRRQEQRVASAVMAAQQIPDSFVKLADSPDGPTQVTSMQDPSHTYEVTHAGTDTARCTCPQGRLHYMCKHVFKVIALSQRVSGAEIILALGTRPGTNQQGLSNLYNSTVGQHQTKPDDLAELHSTFQLECDEQETGDVAQADSAAPAAPVHDSTACQQQIQASCSRLCSMVEDDPDMQLHLLSYVNKTEGALARIQASNIAGTAHPMAPRLSKVQDSWGNSVVRKRTIGLDGFPKAKRKVAQPTPASQPVQAEAAPFTKPQPARKKAGPRQQARVASALTGQENSSAAANQQQQQPASAAAANKPSSAPKSQHMRRCGSCANCLRPQAKKVCLTNQALRAQLAAQP